jgi:GNAT superfamily N-acetyltransferase
MRHGKVTDLALGDENLSEVKFHPLTAERWLDLETLFGKRGACGGCWCMYWRSNRSDFLKNRGETNRKALQKLVESGTAPGILAYSGGQPVGWCSVCPREAFVRLERSRVLKRIDDKPVWSVVCFFVSKPFRRRGMSVRLLKATVEYVRSQGGKIVEGYPFDHQPKRMPDPFVYTGLAQSFRKAGFTEVARRSKNRPVMRYFL